MLNKLLEDYKKELYLAEQKVAEKDAEIERLTGVITLDCKKMEESSDKLKAAEQKVAKYEKALKEISAMGRVCEGFELCTHVACADSCGSTLIALEALKEEVTV